MRHKNNSNFSSLAQCNQAMDIEIIENVEHIQTTTAVESIDLLDKPHVAPPAIMQATLPENLKKNQTSQALQVSYPVNSFDAYVQTIQAIPILTEQEESDLMQDWYVEKNMEAARRLILSHLRLVYATCRQYLGYGLSTPDMMQEGTLGLMMAVKKFEPKFKARLATYAIFWIKAYIHEYILQNWRLVKVASTATQKKLFFKLRSLLPPDTQVTQVELIKIAQQLNVSIQEVNDMHTKLLGREYALEGEGETDEGVPHNHWQAVLACKSPEPLLALELKEQSNADAQLPKLLEDLRIEKPRSYDIIQHRWMNDEKVTMKALSQKMAISIERVNQLEKQGLLWLKHKMEQLNP